MRRATRQPENPAEAADAVEAVTHREKRQAPAEKQIRRAWEAIELPQDEASENRRVTPDMKAKYKGKVRDRNGYAVHLLYEYRGREYMVTDEHNGYSEPMWVKHKNEQDRIDREIEAENKPQAPVRYEDTAEYGFELFWEYCEAEDAQ